MNPLSEKSANRDLIQSSFDKQELINTLGASILSIELGAVEIALAPASANSQQHGGAVAAIADTADRTSSGGGGDHCRQMLAKIVAANRTGQIPVPGTSRVAAEMSSCPEWQLLIGKLS